MQISNKIFVIWTFLVLILIALLTTLGIMLNIKQAPYKKIEAKIEEIAPKYVEENFLYPQNNEVLKITTDQLLEKYLTLDDLKYQNDTCKGYVILKFKNVYEYHAYIKCSKYTTKNYQKES